MKALFTLALLFIACLSYSQQQLLDSVEYIYWGDYTDGTIRKAKLDGSYIATIVDFDSKIRRIRLDRRDRKIIGQADIMVLVALQTMMAVIFLQFYKHQ